MADDGARRAEIGRQMTEIRWQMIGSASIHACENNVNKIIEKQEKEG